MLIVLVNNNTIEMDFLANQLARIFLQCECLQFIDPLLSAKYILNNHVDIVFTAERMRLANGLDLLRIIRSSLSTLPVIIWADDNDMSSSAEKLADDGYWKKPITNEQA